MKFAFWRKKPAVPVARRHSFTCDECGWRIGMANADDLELNVAAHLAQHEG